MPFSSAPPILGEEGRPIDAYLAVVSKREVRNYEPRPIAGDVLARILEAARATGSSRNRQPWRFVMVTDPSRLRNLSALVARPANVARCVAAIAIVLSNPRAVFDAGRVAQNIMVAAWSLGVGSCPNTPTDQTGIQQLLRIPAEMTVPTIMSLGYPARGEPRPRPGANPSEVLARMDRLPLAELVSKETLGSSDAGS